MARPVTLFTGQWADLPLEELAAKAYSYHHIGRIADRPFYEHHIVASNLRMTEWQGAIAYCQTQRIAEQNERRMASFRRLYLARPYGSDETGRRKPSFPVTIPLPPRMSY